MNKFMAAVAFVMIAGVADAKTATKEVPLPPTRPAEITGTGALVTPQGVIVKAPVGSNVTVDVDGKDVDVTVDGAQKNTWLPWNWNIWK